MLSFEQTSKNTEMFEREIKFIYDFSLNQVRRLGSSFTLKQLTTCRLHPALLKYIEAELDFLIYEDRKRFIDKSNFDYSGENILKHFEAIAKEIKTEKRLTLEYISQLLLHAISFNINYLAQPKWALSKLIFPNEETLNVIEVKQILNYLYFYPHIKQVTEKYFVKKQLVIISKTEFEELVEKVQNQTFSLYSKSVFEKVLQSMAEFYNIGSSVKTKVPLTAVELFVKENNIKALVDRFEDAFGSELKLNIEITELQGILFSPVPVKRKPYMDRIVKKEQPDSLFKAEQQEKTEPVVKESEPIKDEIHLQEVAQAEQVKPETEEEIEQDKSLEEVLTDNIQTESLLEELIEESGEEAETTEAEQKIEAEEIDDTEGKIEAEELVEAEGKVEAEEKVAEEITIPEEAKVEEELKEEIATESVEEKEPENIDMPEQPVNQVLDVENKDIIEEQLVTENVKLTPEAVDKTEDTFELILDENDEKANAVDEINKPVLLEEKEGDSLLIDSVSEEVAAVENITPETLLQEDSEVIEESIANADKDIPKDDSSIQIEQETEKSIKKPDEPEDLTEDEIIDDKDIPIGDINFFGPSEKQAGLFKDDTKKIKNENIITEFEETGNVESENTEFEFIQEQPEADLKPEETFTITSDKTSEEQVAEEKEEPASSALESIEKEIAGLDFETEYDEDDFLVIAEESSLNGSSVTVEEKNILHEDEIINPEPDEKSLLDKKDFIPFVHDEENLLHKEEMPEEDEKQTHQDEIVSAEPESTDDKQIHNLIDEELAASPEPENDPEEHEEFIWEDIKELEKFDEESLDLLETNLDEKNDEAELPLVDSAIDDETNYPETGEYLDVEESTTENPADKEKEIIKIDASEKLSLENLKPKIKRADLADLFKGRDAEKIILNIFDEDTQDFLQTCETIAECKNPEEALGVLDSLFRTNRIKPTSKEAVLFKKIVEKYFDEK